MIRTIVIITFLSAIVFLSNKWINPCRLPGKSLIFLFLSGLATGASWLCYFRALQFGAASKVAPIDKLSVVLVAVFAFAFLGERPSAREWTGIAFVALGVFILGLKK